MEGKERQSQRTIIRKTMIEIKRKAKNQSKRSYC